jgi:hypothetical protein
MTKAQWESIVPGVMIEGRGDLKYKRWAVKGTVRMDGQLYAVGLSVHGMPFIWSRGWVEANCNSLFMPDGTVIYAQNPGTRVEDAV